MIFIGILISFLIIKISGLDNGLGRTPPMGWLSWLRYRCTIDCKKYPNDCISENLIISIADKMSQEYRNVGYEYIMIDDCWLARNRAANGSLLADPERFPRGMRFLTDYVHRKGLKFGIYEDYGLKTCAGYPGSLGHLKTDAFTFANWGVDYVKFDGCWSFAFMQPLGVELFSKFLNETGRPIFLNVEWPLYMGVKHMSNKKISLLIQTTNMARVYNDIDDNWNSLLGVINFYKKNANNFSSWSRPGYFNDPDMLLIGNNYLTVNQEKLQMVMWAIFAGPLIMSNDLRNISNSSKSILTNRNTISINQDPLGIQGRFIKTIRKFDYWVRPLSPALGHQRIAIAVLNLEDQTTKDSFSIDNLNVISPGMFSLLNVFSNNRTEVSSDKVLTFSLAPTSAILLLCQSV